MQLSIGEIERYQRLKALDLANVAYTEAPLMWRSSFGTWFQKCAMPPKVRESGETGVNVSQLPQLLPVSTGGAVGIRSLAKGVKLGPIQDEAISLLVSKVAAMGLKPKSFSTLPPELRLKIWTLSIEGRVIQAVQLLKGQVSQMNTTPGAMIIFSESSEYEIIGSKLPGWMETCHEARDEAIRVGKYMRLFTTTTSGNPVWFSPVYDTLEFFSTLPAFGRAPTLGMNRELVDRSQICLLENVSVDISLFEAIGWLDDTFSPFEDFLTLNCLRKLTIYGCFQDSYFSELFQLRVVFEDLEGDHMEFSPFMIEADGSRFPASQKDVDNINHLVGLPISRNAVIHMSTIWLKLNDMLQSCFWFPGYAEVHFNYFPSFQVPQLRMV